MMTLACCRPARRPSFAFVRPAETASPHRRLPLDVFETGDAFEVRAELPGIAKDDIAVEVADQRLTIRAQAKREAPDNATPLLVELSRDRVERSIELPAAVDGDRAEARHVDGVLHLRLPKRSAEHSRRLVVN
jgi:HSP20 family protein